MTPGKVAENASWTRAVIVALPPFAPVPDVAESSIRAGAPGVGGALGDVDGASTPQPAATRAVSTAIETLAIPLSSRSAIPDRRAADTPVLHRKTARFHTDISRDCSANL
jgi:hypothetical protein